MFRLFYSLISCALSFILCLSIALSIFSLSVHFWSDTTSDFVFGSNKTTKILDFFCRRFCTVACFWSNLCITLHTDVNTYLNQRNRINIRKKIERNQVFVVSKKCFFFYGKIHFYSSIFTKSPTYYFELDERSISAVIEELKIHFFLKWK